MVVTSVSTATRPVRGSTSRAARVLSASGIGYFSQFLTVAVGMWLTPFLLHRLGAADYGLWLLALQMTAYLSLLDLGVVALLPRETSFAIGRAAGNRSSSELPALIARTTSIVLCQLPIVALCACAGFLLLPEAWHALHGPLLVIAFSFLVMFPARILHAVLQGLQETPFLARVAVGTWALGTATTVLLVLSGIGLYAVAIGWLTTQTVSTALWWFRLRSRYAHVLPRALPRFSRELVAGWSHSGLWVSVAQIAQMLLAGTDLVIIGHALGPAAIVPYAVTGKLISVLANQPQMVMQAAQPALSELRATVDARHRLLDVTTALTQLMLLISGAVFLIVLATNQGFVGWWVGSSQYAGLAVTVALLASMLLRHWNTTTVYTMFAFGNERRIALTALADGMVTVVAALLLVHRLGSLGAVIASIVGVSVVSLPNNLKALAASTSSTIGENLAPLANWFVRFGLLGVILIVLMRSWIPDSLAGLVVATLGVSLAYWLVMFSVLRRPPLAEYTLPRLRLLVDRLTGARFRADHSQRTD